MIYNKNMEEQHETLQKPQNPVFGRKIFFLNPPYAVQKGVVEKLRANEYEVYLLNNFKRAKAVLRQYPDSILFIGIDCFLDIKAWYNFIKSFENDSVLKTIYIGVLSQIIRRSEKDQFLTKLNLACGFIMLDQGMETITNQIIKICDINGAKGRRQYVRLDCKHSTDSSVHVTIDGRLLTLKLIDISTVGFACALPINAKNRFTEKQVLKGIVISLGLKSINCEAAVFAIKPGPVYDTLVMLLMPTTSPSTRNIIRNYVFTTLQNNLEKLTESVRSDMTDYSRDDSVGVTDASQKFVIESENEINLDSIEELEDIGDVEEVFS